MRSQAVTASSRATSSRNQNTGASRIVQLQQPPRDASRPELSGGRLVDAVRLLARSVDVLARRIHALEQRAPAVPEILSTREVEIIYAGQISRTTLYKLSDPRRQPRVLSRYRRPRGGTGWSRAEIERYLRGVPEEPVEARVRRAAAND